MQFRKKPVVIEAWQMPPNDGMTRPAPPAWVLAGVVKVTGVGAIETITNGGAYIHTLEGRMHCEIGDWIIQGVKGELYSCKPDIFELTYEPVTQ